MALATAGCSDDKPAATSAKANDVVEKGAAKPAAGAKADAPTTGEDKRTSPSDAPPLPVSGGLPFSAPSSTIGFVGEKVIGSEAGSFSTFDGQLVTDGAMPKAVAVRIDLRSVQVGPAKLRKHLLSSDFFDVEKTPWAVFQSRSFEEGGDAKITHFVIGDLTLHGVTKEVRFPIAYAATPKQITVEADFPINRKDFGIVYPGSPDNLIQDEVPLRLRIVVPRK